MSIENIPIDIFLECLSNKELILLGLTNKYFYHHLVKFIRNNKIKELNLEHESIQNKFIMPNEKRHEFIWNLESMNINNLFTTHIKIIINYYHNVLYVELIGLNLKRPAYQYKTLIHERVIPPNEQKLRNIIYRIISINILNWAVNKYQSNEFVSSNLQNITYK